MNKIEMIQNKLSDFNFVLLGGDDGKKPIEKSWQKKIHKSDDEELIKHVEKNNYGIRTGNTSPVIINNSSWPLIVVDFDRQDVQDELLKKLPETFTVKTGGKGLYHLYFASDDCKSYKILDEKMNTLMDVQGEGKQIVGPGSINKKNGKPYEIIKDISISFISYPELKALLMPYDKSPKKTENIKTPIARGLNTERTDEIINAVSMKEVLGELGIDTSKNPTCCPFHDSVGGKCLGWNDRTAHCFHCNGSWNRYSLLKAGKGLTDKKTFEWFAAKGNNLDKLISSRKEYSKNKKEEIKAAEIFGRKGQALHFIEKQPLFYDKNGLFWLWNWELYCYEIVDDIDVLNMIEKQTGANVISSKERSEILNALKQEGRKKIPFPIKSTWIQFQSMIFDIETGNEFLATPEYFAVNPLPYSLHEEKFVLTPTMDKIFTEWVGSDYVKTLYEIIAYCCIPDYPINRLFCLVGGGMNGKSCYLRLLRKFIGEKNICSTELDTLLNSRFEVTRLHKKLVCMMGETNFNEMNHTSMLKKLTGGDLIGFEYKGKNPFEDINYAKIIIATNNLPSTTDKTIGFYRRWMIIDFPNEFGEQKDILADIPEDEYKALARKICLMLKDILKDRKFHNEGSVEERMERYESRSNFIDKFIQTFTTNENVEGYITCNDFYKKFTAWCKDNRLREVSEIAINKIMKEHKYEQEKKFFSWMYDGKGGVARIWAGISWK